MELHVAPGFDAAGLAHLVTTHPYNDYRHYRTIPTGVSTPTPLALRSSERQSRGSFWPCERGFRLLVS